ncbi:hypothetical protein F4821DRAFT_229390 [Hypoxylon rubiginosum]|uniref:Uncharacterized protein n=1 Tax=Hypoxylon rubiginosum TaxID=110542 RepID=A0ACC0DCL0_9PEZI|nr:hypothetical protein F4821DRAFT_229390 [Hypoxylon rubiginosum]
MKLNECHVEPYVKSPNCSLRDSRNIVRSTSFVVGSLTLVAPISLLNVGFDTILLCLAAVLGLVCLFTGIKFLLNPLLPGLSSSILGVMLEWVHVSGGNDYWLIREVVCVLE